MWKVLAIVSAIVLVGGYIYFRSGADRKVMPGTKSERMAEQFPGLNMPATQPTTQPEGFKLKESIAREFELMSSSKSGPIARPEMFESTTQPATAPNDR